MHKKIQHLNYSFFQKSLSSFLSFVMVAYVTLFSAAAAVHAAGEFDVACADGEVCEYLLFPLENPPVDAGEGAPLNPQGNIIEDITGNNTPSEQCESRGGTWDPEQEACNESWLEETNPTGMGQSNGQMIGGIAGGVAAWAAGAYFPDAVTAVGDAIMTPINGGIDGATSAWNSAAGAMDSPLYGSSTSGAVDASLSAASDTLVIQNGLADAVGGAAIGGLVAGLVTLVLTGDIKAAAMAAVQSVVVSLVANYLGGGAVAAALGGGLGATAATASTFAASSALTSSVGLLGLGPLGWALIIGLALMMIMCPVVGVELPTGQMVAVSTFLVGKINAQMEGESWEKLLLNNDHLEILNNEENITVAIGEILPEILYLNKLSIFDVVWDAAKQGSWYVDQDGDMEFIQTDLGSFWKNKDEEGIKEVDWIGMFQTGEEVEVLDSAAEENEKIQQSELDVNFLQVSNSELQFTIKTQAPNEEVKILTTGGIQEIYHAEKFRMLAKFRPVLLWFYKVVDNTFLGKVMEREVLAKEGFTLQEKIDGDWENVHQWITYADQPRLITLKNTGEQRELRIIYEGEYLSLFDVQVQISKNPEYTITELESEDLFETLRENDENYEVVQTGQMHKFNFALPVINTETQSREIFMNTSGYYHPLADWQMVEEYNEQNERLREWGDKITGWKMPTMN